MKVMYKCLLLLCENISILRDADSFRMLLREPVSTKRGYD
jgi:hypothetical protein